MRIIIVGLAVCTLVLSGSNDSQASSCCEQTFFVLAKTGGDHSLLIYKEKLDGECYCTTNLFFLFLEPDTISVYRTLYCEDPEKEWNLPNFRDLMTEKCLRPSGQGGRIVLNDSMSVIDPTEDTTFLDRFGDSTIGMGVPGIWYKRCTIGCLDEPTLDFPAELVYYHERGVYKNYTITNVWYWEETGYLLLQTENPHLAAGLDTMHGMLLYRVINQ